uniref:Arginine/serine-rich protein 1 n=1 Tax=Sphenodon punctatus TaxID=8508 RepID=A0A8D0GJE9_SPHPU
MTDFMDDLTPSSPKEREAHSRSRERHGGRSCSRSCSRFSYSSRSWSSTSTSSRSWSGSRSRSRLHARRNGPRGYRRYSRSYSRSRSRACSYRCREGYYGFGKTIYREVYRSWRTFSCTEKRELLEVAKANAAKALGTDSIVLPASLRIDILPKETSRKWKSEDGAEWLWTTGAGSRTFTLATPAKATMPGS